MFAHPAGDDCAGEPLPGVSAQVAAAIPAVPPAASPSPPTLSAAVAPANREPAPGIHLPDEASRPAAGAASAAPTTPTDDAAPAAAALVAAPAPDRIAAPPVPFERVASVAPLAPPEVAAPARPTFAPASGVAEMQPPADLAFRAAAVATEPQAGPVASAPASSAKAAPTPTLAEIAFAPDSSDLPADAIVRLEALVAALPREAAWEVELQAAVGDRAGRLSVEEALAYNRWLAEQRQGRVEEWLGTHPRAPVLRVRRSLLPHDPSRRLVISARPLP